jgi:splicing factor 1
VKINLGLPTTIVADSLTEDQLKQYLRIMRIEDISRRLRANDVLPASGERSPSPMPEYGGGGVRSNTREERYAKKYEEERRGLIDEAMAFDPTFRPPNDFRRVQKLSDKIYIPCNEFPEINFMGLLIGPRGNTLKKMETETGAKISIRGRGTLKEGKGKEGKLGPGDDDEMHCFVTVRFSVLERCLRDRPMRNTNWPRLSKRLRKSLSRRARCPNSKTNSSNANCANWPC